VDKVEVRYIGGPLDGTTGEYDYPLPLAVRMATARKPIHMHQLVTEDQLEPGGAQYRLVDGDLVYVEESAAL
jgi:hypothetical protein